MRAVRDHPAIEVAILAAWGVFWGMAYGIVINLWFWPYVFGPTQASMYWQRGIGLRETLSRYLAFYALTSSWWDTGRALGNALILALFGAPLLRLLRRFGKRFTFDLQPSQR